MSDKSQSVNSGALSPLSEDIIKRHRDEGWVNLEPDKRSFAMAYIHTNSHTQAARDINKAGQGLKYFRDPLVRVLIADLQKEAHEVSLINRQFVEQKMLETLDKLEGNEAIPMVTGQGVPIEEKKFHSGEVVNLLKEMGKISGIIPEKDGGPTGGVQVVINMNALLGEDTDGITIDSTTE